MCAFEICLVHSLLHSYLIGHFSTQRSSFFSCKPCNFSKFPLFLALWPDFVSQQLCQKVFSNLTFRFQILGTPWYSVEQTCSFSQAKALPYLKEACAPFVCFPSRLTTFNRPTIPMDDKFKSSISQKMVFRPLASESLKSLLKRTISDLLSQNLPE